LVDSSLSLSLIIPTIGRPTLKRTLDSLQPQLLPEDEVLLVDHGYHEHVAELAADYGCRYFRDDTPTPYGGARRNMGMRFATGTHLHFMDDDDTYAPRALAAIREALLPDTVLMFQIMCETGVVLWEEPRFEYGKIQTEMFVIPNYCNLPRWPIWHQGGPAEEYTFITEVVSKLVLPVVWVPEVIGLIHGGPPS
jgi:glycosyltransferase involved in cell wall biosynthesis